MAATIGRIYESLSKYEQDNYYLKNAEPQKFGRGWERLKNVEINDQTYRALVKGKDPLTGQHLVDIRNGHRPGYNITFSPDKSFSVAAFSYDPEMRKALLDAHHAAVRDTLSYMEKELTQVRQGVDGEKIPVKTANLVGFTIDHTCNRSGDVQVHTHAVVFNMSCNEQTQKWQALHSDAFKSNVLEKIYENQLAYHLHQRGFAVEWKQSESGKTQYIAVAGVPEAAIEATSQRAAEIKEAVEKLKGQYPNATPGELKQIAAYETRPDKREMTLEQIEKQFQSRLEQAGLTKEDIVRGIEQAKQQWQEQRLESIQMNEYEVAKQAYSVLSEQKAVFSQQDLLKTAMDISKGDVPIEKIQVAVNDFMRDKELIRLAQDLKIKDGSRIYADSLFTTKENLLAEKNIFKIVEQSKNSLESIYSREQVLNEIKDFEQKSGFQMTESQRNAVITAMTTKDMVTLYQGYAGVGKTESLKVINELAQKAGYKVMGMSETNVAVGEMRKVGIESFTVTKFLNSSQLKSQVDSKTILVVDECSFMGARNMEKILNIAKENNAKVYLFGDKNQLPPINAGYPFRDLQERGNVTVVEMKDIIRQKDPLLKEAVQDIIKQDIDKAFEKLNVVELKENLNQETAKLYVEKNGYRDHIISTYTNHDKNLLNNEIRNLLKEQGILSKNEHTFTVYTPKNLQGSDKLNIHNYSIGDRLIATRAGAGAKVGAELTITYIDRQNHLITAQAVTKQGLKEYQIDIRRYGDHFNVYSPEQRNFSVGDKIIFNANLKEDKQLKAANSEIGYIKSIQGSQITIQKGKETLTFDASKFQYFDHGYASTTYKAQGKTAQGAIYFAPVQEKGPHRSYQDFYVSVSRAKTHAFVITNDKEKLKEQVKNFSNKESIASIEQKYNLNILNIKKQDKIDLSKNFKFYSENEKQKYIKANIKSNVIVSKNKQTVLIKEKSLQENKNKSVNELFLINVKSFKRDLEKIKKHIKDKDKIKHIEKAQKQFDYLVSKSDFKHYTKAKFELKKVNIDLDKIREQSKTKLTSKSQVSDISKSESKTVISERTISNEKVIESISRGR